MAEPPEVAEILFETSEELREIALSMTIGCGRTLDIASRHLDPLIYDHEPFVEAVKQVVLNNRRAQVRILICDLAPVVQRGHRLLDLAKRLSSYISVRKPGPDYKNFNEAMLLADTRSYIYRQLADRYDGVASYDDIRRAQDLKGRFNEVWQRADIDSNLRRLHI